MILLSVSLVEMSDECKTSDIMGSKKACDSLLKSTMRLALLKLGAVWHLSVVQCVHMPYDCMLDC